MPLPIVGQIGPVTGSDGNQVPFRQGRSGEQIVTELHGRYYENTYRKNVFTAYCQAQAVTSLTTAACVGLQLWNGSPLTNGVNLVLLKTGGYISVTSASLTGLVLASGTQQAAAPTAQTAATSIKNNFLGGTAPQATATAAATFTAAPTAHLSLEHNTAAIATTGEDFGYLVDLEGSIVVPPQCFVAVNSIGAAGAASAWNGYLMWEEVAV